MTSMPMKTENCFLLYRSGWQIYDGSKMVWAMTDQFVSLAGS